MKAFLIDKCKNDTILVVSFVLAVISCFFVTPDAGYADYINLRVLAVLFALMLVVQAFARIGCFAFVTQKLVGAVKSEKLVSLLLVYLSLFSSMLITNDVALVTLIPFAIMVLSAFHDARRMKYTLILMTAAANLGSMLTPIGNPQNLYLFTEYHLSAGSFIRLMLPYTVLSLVLITAFVIILNKTDKTADVAITENVSAPDKKRMLVYLILFLACVLTVAGVFPYYVMLAVVIPVMLLADRRAFLDVDYSLLFTFTFFFILIGNLGRIDVIRNSLSAIVGGHEVATAVLSSQVISNVPAAMLLSPFTENGRALIVGVNLGGLGTLIASMASLITYKFYAKHRRELATAEGETLPKEGGHYLLDFTWVSILLLGALLGLYVFLR